MKKSIYLVLSALFLLNGLLSAQIKMDIPGGVRAVSDGQGQVTLVWFPPLGIWPEGGFRIEDQKGKVLVDGIRPFAELGDLETLNPEDRDWIKRLQADPSALYSQDKKHDKDRLTLVLKAALQPRFSSIFGLSRKLSDLPGGKQAYRVVGLNKRGQKTSMVLSSPAIDARTQTGLPPKPGKLAALVTQRGVELNWPQETGKNRETVYYQIERKNKGGDFLPVLDKPLLSSSAPGAPSTEAAFVDNMAPQESEVEYRVVGVDFFGRRSQPSDLKIFVPAFRSRVPPTGLTLGSDKKGVRVKWDLGSLSAKTRFAIERSSLAKGPFRVITPEGVSHSPEGYLDSEPQRSSLAYYRIRTIASDGQFSHPSEAVLHQKISTTLPVQVKAVQARVGITEISLTWPAVNGDLAGYLIERQSGTEWRRVNDEIWDDTTFHYAYTAADQVEMKFRVRAVGQNSQVGPASEPVVISILRMPREIPTIESIKQVDRGIEIHFDYPTERKDIRFLVRRSDEPYGEGMAISPLLEQKQSPFVDEQVAPGQTYFYRVQVMGLNQWAGASSKALNLTFRSRPLAAPAAPKAERLTQPFNHIRLSLPKRPVDVLLVIERRVEGERYWQTLSNQCSDTTYIDATPPRRTVEYRLRHIDSAGLTSEASASVKLNI